MYFKVPERLLFAFKTSWSMLNSIRGKTLVWIIAFIVMLVNFCFQVVLVRRLLWEYIWTFDVVLTCLSACFLLSKPHLEHAELDKRKNPGVNICFHRNINQFLLWSCPCRTPSLRIHSNFWCILKCLSACFLLSKPLLEHAELDKRKNPGVNNCLHRNVSQFLLSSCLVGRLLWEYIWSFDVVLKCLSACVWFRNFIWDMLNSRWKEKLGQNICFLFTVSQFLISSCPWTAFLRIRLNLWCSFKVSERQRRLLIRGCSLGNLLVWKAAIWECFKWRCFCSHRPRKTAQ